MKFDFVVLGATGMQGRIVARDLLEKGYSVLLCGRDKPRIEHFLKRYKRTDFRFVEARRIRMIARAVRLSGSDMVINCMEGDWNLNAMKACIMANANYIDLGSEIPMTRKQLAMDRLLRKKNLIAVTGIGSVPGIGNVMLSYAAEKFDRMESVEVGFAWDSNIKKFVVPFSMKSIIEEFTDPAPVVERRRFVNRVPMDSIIEDYHRGIGKQKQFLVRHPEQLTFFHYFRDKGIRRIRFYAGFPEHSFRAITTLIALRLGRKEPIKYERKRIAPVDFLAEALKDLTPPKGYLERENLWVHIRGSKGGKRKEILMECVAPTIKGWEDAGCNIDTGIPASILARMIKGGLITKKGSFAPEAVVPPRPFFKELSKREMVVLENGRVIN